MATLGKTDIGINVLQLAGWITGTGVFLSEKASVSKISIYLNLYPSGGNVKCAIYDEIGKLVAETEIRNDCTATAWNDFDFASNVTLYPGRYYLVVMAEGSSTLNTKGTVEPPDRNNVFTPQVYGAWPSQIVIRDSIFRKSIYATYTSVDVSGPVVMGLKL